MVPENSFPRRRLAPRVPACSAPRAARAAAIALASLLFGANAWGELYVCTSVTGSTISGDRPPQECKDRDIRVLNNDGSLNRLIPAPLTKEQRRKRQAEDEERMRQEELERAQAHRDRALLETYGSVDEIEAARRRTLAGRQMLIDRADQRLAQYAKERKRLEDEAEFYAKRDLPTKLKDAFEANTVLVQQQEKTRADAVVEMQHISERFDAEKQRFQELEDMAAKAAQAREREANQQN